ISSGNFGEHDLLGEPTRFSDQDPSGLGQPFDDQRGGHDRIAGEMIVQMLLSQCEVLDRRANWPLRNSRNLSIQIQRIVGKAHRKKKKGGKATPQTASSPWKPKERG